MYMVPMEASGKMPLDTTKVWTFSCVPHYHQDSTQSLIPETDAVFSKGNNNFSIASKVTGHKNIKIDSLHQSCNNV